MNVSVRKIHKFLKQMVEGLSKKKCVFWLSLKILLISSWSSSSGNLLMLKKNSCGVNDTVILICMSFVLWVFSQLYKMAFCGYFSIFTQANLNHE